MKKMLPRIPIVKTYDEFAAFSQAGRELAKLHLNYETVSEYPLQESYATMYAEHRNYTVSRMKFGGKRGSWDQSVIKYNDYVTLAGVPSDAYKYEVGGKSAIEWIMDRYCRTTDNKNGISKDPNQWSDDPAYILSLLKRVVYVSVESVKIIKNLPDLKKSLP